MERSTTSRQYVTFLLQGDLYALPIEAIAYVVPWSSTTRVPLAASFMEGLISVRGALLPVVNGVRWVSGAEREASEERGAGKIVVLRSVDGEIGFAVGRMQGVAEADDAERFGMSAGETHLYESVFLRGDAIVRVIRPEAVFASLRAEQSLQPSQSVMARKARAPAQETRDGAAGRQRLIRFVARGETFGLAAERVHEILSMPDRVSPINGLPPFVMGMGVFRGRQALPIVRLDGLLFGACEGEPRRVICVEIRTPRGAARIGLAVDRVQDVQAGTDGEHVELAAYLQSEAGYVREAIRIPSGAPMYMLDEARLLGAEGPLGRLFSGTGAGNAALRGEDAATVHAPEAEGGILYLFFQIDGQEFGMPAGGIKEIRRLAGVTPVPHAPKTIAGVTNVRGRILTVSDAKRAMGLADRGDERIEHLLVLDDDGVERGVAVAKATRVVRLAPGQTSQPFYTGDAGGAPVQLIPPSNFV